MNGPTLSGAFIGLAATYCVFITIVVHTFFASSCRSNARAWTYSTAVGALLFVLGWLV